MTSFANIGPYSAHYTLVPCAYMAIVSIMSFELLGPYRAHYTLVSFAYMAIVLNVRPISQPRGPYSAPSYVFDAMRIYMAIVSKHVIRFWAPIRAHISLVSIRLYGKLYHDVICIKILGPYRAHIR